MTDTNSFTGHRSQDYPQAISQAARLWDATLPLYANLANMSALLKQCVDRTNWVGFYLWEPAASHLILGPFQGLPACTRIPLGKGVCGTAVSKRATQRVADVSAFPGHIACDAESRSEIVVPILRDGSVLGVLDLDSPVASRFNEADQAFLEAFIAALIPLWPA
jgi:GAF domain-containing protein